jgi:PAS domain-containing protein
MEYRARAKDGEWRWILDRGKTTALDAQGRPLRMAGTLTDVTERRGMDEALRRSLEEVRRHDTQMVELNRMNDLLLSCETREEAYAVIAEGAELLFAPYAGGLAVGDGAASELHRVAAWGAAGGLSPTFSMHECWALRRGQPYEVEPSRDEIDCSHFLDRPPPAYVCVPLNVRGTALGLLHVSADQALTAKQFQELRTLAVTVGESIKLALSNIKLQEALRDARR